MKKDEIVQHLIELREVIKKGGLRKNLTDRRFLLGKATALLNFDEMLQANAIQAADILSQPEFSSSMYSRMEGRLDFILSQGIHELELGIKPRNMLGNKIFIGHGRSPVWRDLKDFLSERLSLEWEEFNRVPIAGVSNTSRLQQMLEESVFAFLVLTAEDEQPDGRYHPRLNVVHEAGLFQGRLGLEKAIVLLEEGCEEFSNIVGLGQIRFPKGKVSTKFEDIRAVLEREGIITKS
jgi:hypothetical protein